MKGFRKIWNDETNGFLAKCRDLSREDCYRVFMAKFPDSGVTFIALCNQLSRLGLRPHLKYGSTRTRPLYSEQVKKGYVRIKVAQPNVWMMKSKWVYMETHPWEDFSERSNYVFLDGNNRNFDPSNIERVPLRLMSGFSRAGGCARGYPELTRLRISLARLWDACLDAGEKEGMTAKYGHARMFRDDVNRKAAERRKNPELRKKQAERARRYIERIRQEDPARYEDMMRRQRVYKREWARRKREEGK